MKLKSYERIALRTDRLNDDSVVIKFDVYSDAHHEVTKDIGYVHIRQELGFFNMVVFDCEGNLLSKVNVPFKSKEE